MFVKINGDLKQKVNLIVKYFSLKKFNEVILRIKPLINDHPQIIELYNILGLAYIYTERNKEGIEILEKALKIDTKNTNEKANILNNLGLLHSRIFNEDKSIEFYKKSLSIKPNFFQAVNNLALIYSKLNNSEKSIKILKGIEKQETKNQIFNHTMASSYMHTGDFENAKKYANKIIKDNPNNCAADFILSQLTNYKNDNTHLEIMKNKNEEKLNLENKIHLNFSFGKAYEDLQDYKNSFHHYKLANDLMNNLVKYNIEDEKIKFKKIIKFFENYNLTKIKSLKNEKQIIFIVGMPRSGTTLAEQIISSHSKVYGAGELPWMHYYFKNIFFKNKNSNLKNLNLISVKKLFLKKISIFNRNEQYIIDKNPLNFYSIGLILSLFENCKIIHCKRNPMDTCLSNYKYFFSNKDIGYCYNLSNLGKFYKLYENLMDFWNKKYEGKIYNLDYECLVENPNIEIKSLIKFCNLPWEEKCLEFYKNKKTVTTLSGYQVRQKIYKTSVKKWEKYSDYLTELKKFLI